MRQVFLAYRKCEPFVQQAVGQIPWGIIFRCSRRRKSWKSVSGIAPNGAARLVKRIREFLMELGAGFAFMDSQYHLEVGGRDFYIDLLFYHHRLRCLIAIDLKMQDFEPEFGGKMNFYLSALDDLVRHPDDAPSMGIVLCRGKERTIAEYSLRDMSKPMGVADYRLTTSLPAELQNALPAPADLERILQDAPPKT